MVAHKALFRHCGFRSIRSFYLGAKRQSHRSWKQECVHRSKVCQLRIVSPGKKRFYSTSSESLQNNSLKENLARVHEDLLKLQSILNAHVVGHADVKEAMILGLLSKEHVYIEGPPGVAKTMLSELVGHSAALNHWFYQLHRDVRLNELIGEAVITKDKDNTSGSSEVIRQNIIRGGILKCEIAVLDDISRAPGEALNVLLRILNERSYGSDLSQADSKIPLISAIATGNPANEDGYYAEPLDPATLDRFTFQLRSYGLVNQGDWMSVSSVIDMYARPHEVDASSAIEKLSHNSLKRAGELVPLVVLGTDTKEKLIKFLKILRDDYNLTEENSLLSDRTFLVKAVRALKAHSILNGRFVCEPSDLFVLRFLTTFRVPEEVHEKIEEIIARAISDSEDSPISPPESDGSSGGEPQQKEKDSNSNQADGKQKGEKQTKGETDSESNVENNQRDSDSDSERSSSSSSNVGESGDEDMEASSSQTSSNDESGNARGKSNQEGTKNMRNEEGAKKPDDPETKCNGKPEESTRKPEKKNISRAKVDNLDTLLKSLDGRLEKGSSSQIADPGGIPRGWSRPRTFSDINDSDFVEASLWCDNPSPQLPRTYSRTRKRGGGRVAILRDTSMSMEGLWNTWTNILCLNVIGIASRKGMRVGYLEFNDKVEKHISSKKSFFTKDYNALKQRMTNVKCDGLTNYELPLATALEEFVRIKSRGTGMTFQKSPDQHILFITDGRPTAGDRYVVRELHNAKKMGVAIHTVFIGYSTCPKVLDKLSGETDGLKYSAFLNTSSRKITVQERDSGLDLPGKNLNLDIGKLNMMAKMPAVFQRYLDESGVYGDDNL